MSRVRELPRRRAWRWVEYAGQFLASVGIIALMEVALSALPWVRLDGHVSGFQGLRWALGLIGVGILVDRLCTRKARAAEERETAQLIARGTYDGLPVGAYREGDVILLEQCSKGPVVAVIVVSMVVLAIALPSTRTPAFAWPVLFVCLNDFSFLWPRIFSPGRPRWRLNPDSLQKLGLFGRTVEWREVARVVFVGGSLGTWGRDALRLDSREGLLGVISPTTVEVSAAELLDLLRPHLPADVETPPEAEQIASQPTHEVDRHG